MILLARLIRLKLFALLLCVTYNLCAQNPTVGQIPEKVIQAFEVGNTQLLTQFLAKRVTVSVDGKLNTFTSKQVQEFFKGFFSQHPPIQFERLHQGVAQNDLLYYIARYTSTNQVYRIYLQARKFRETYRVQSISIDITK